MRTIVDGYANHAPKLSALYSSLEPLLAADGIALSDLKIVTMIAAGGCPFLE